jgi:hypothetical protein
MELISTLEKSIADLTSSKKVGIVENSGVKPLNDEQIDTLKQELEASPYKNDVNLIAKYLKLPMKIRVEWEYKLDGQDQVGGRIDLHNPAIALLDDRYAVIDKRSVADGKPQDIGHLKYFEKDLTNGESFGATISVYKTKSLELGVFTGKAYYKMQLTFEEYIKYLSLTKGFIYWQFLFCENLPEDVRKDIRQNYATRMIKDLPRLFPRENFTDVEEVVRRF